MALKIAASRNEVVRGRESIEGRQEGNRGREEGEGSCSLLFSVGFWCSIRQAHLSPERNGFYSQKDRKEGRKVVSMNLTMILDRIRH